MSGYLIVASVAWAGALVLHLDALRVPAAAQRAPAGHAMSAPAGECPLTSEAFAWLYLVLAYAATLGAYLDGGLPHA